jgi:hypothetical protein
VTHRWLAAVLMLAALLLAAGSFAAGWSLSDRSDSRPKGSCVAGQLKEEYGPDALSCSSNAAVLEYKQEHSVVCARTERWASADAGSISARSRTSER